MTPWEIIQAGAGLIASYYIISCGCGVAVFVGAVALAVWAKGDW